MLIGVAVLVLIFLGVMAFSSSHSRSTASSPSGPSQATKIINKCQNYSIDYLNAELEDPNTASCTLMHNDTDDSYTFSLRHEGQDDDFIEFYLAKIHLADDNYMYAIYVTGPQSMLDDNRYFYPDSQHCPIIFVDNSSEPVDIDSIESNFDISEVKDFNMKVENQY